MTQDAIRDEMCEHLATLDRLGCEVAALIRGRRGIGSRFRELPDSAHLVLARNSG